MNNEKEKGKETGMEKSSFNTRKLKYGAMATAITVFVVAIVVLLNLIAGVLTEKKGLKLDLTSQKYFNVSQDTVDFIKSINKDVKIEVFNKKENMDDNNYYRMVMETLAKYPQNSDHVEVNYYDITENPDVVSKYSGSYSGELTNGDIVVACGDKVKVTSITKLFNINSQTGAVLSYKGEQEITSLLMNVTADKQVKAAIIAAYNNDYIFHRDLYYSVQTFAGLLNKNGYEIGFIDILNDELSPEEYDIVVLPAPYNDLPDSCISKLEDFLYNGGSLDKNMIYLADIYQRKTPAIDAFLEIWGVKVGEYQVYEPDNNRVQNINIVRNNIGYAQSAKAPIADIADSAYSEGLPDTKRPIVVPATRNIEILIDGSNTDRTVNTVLKTAGSSILYPLNLTEAEEITFDADMKPDSAKTEADKDDDNGTEADGEEPTEADTDAAKEKEENTTTTEFDFDKAERSEQVVMALAQKTATDSANEVHTNNLLIVGGISFTDQYISNVSTFNNAEFIVNLTNKICGKENAIIIAEKNFESSAIDVTESQRSTIEYVVVFGFPVIVIICGTIVFVRRKNR